MKNKPKCIHLLLTELTWIEKTEQLLDIFVKKNEIVNLTY